MTKITKLHTWGLCGFLALTPGFRFEWSYWSPLAGSDSWKRLAVRAGWLTVSVSWRHEVDA